MCSSDLGSGMPIQDEYTLYIVRQYAKGRISLGGVPIGLHGLKGHRSVGGMRASIYNAMPEAGVDSISDQRNVMGYNFNRLNVLGANPD